MSDWHETHQTVVHAWMCDHFGHMNVRYYAHLFDDAGFALWAQAGITRALFEAAGLHMVVARTETDFRQEVVAGTIVRVVSRFERLGTKSVHYVQELRDVETDQLHASQRAVEVFFDPKTREARPAPASIRQMLEPLVGGSKTDATAPG